MAPETELQRHFGSDVFKSLCQEKGDDISLENCTAVELNDALSRLYVSLRTKEGGDYKRSSSVTLCAPSNI